MKRFKNIFFILLFSFLISGSLYSESKDEEINICTTDYLNIREEPNINSKIMKGTTKESLKLQLRISDTVRVIKRSEKEEIVAGKKGRWAYVDPGYSDKTCGWVFDFFLAKKNDFVRLNSLPDNLVLKINDEDTIFHYEFYKDASAIQVIDSEETLKGKIFIDSKNKIILIKYDHENELTLSMNMRTFLFKDGKICVVGTGKSVDTCSVVKK